ncbi:MAG TPA: methylenetetrahydrofolate reductase [Nocardioides sp.]|nr:methylenetetrahydrofolate reductase [Nocardioides sp.]
MTRSRTRTEVLESLLTRVRYEVLPTTGVVDEVHGHLPAGATVTVTASPAKGMEETLDISERLAAQGFDVVPHLAARMISGHTHLAEITHRLRLAGVTTVFVPTGDSDPQKGAYRSALQVLEDLRNAGDPFAEVGITGYPESHPSINDDLTIQAMWDKRHYATQIISNLTFDPAVLAAWVARVRARGVQLPVLVGLPGPVERMKLLRMATKIGMGESARFLSKNAGLFTRIAAPSGYDPLRFLGGATQVLGLPEMNVAGLHLFTFNQVAETEAWRLEQLRRLRDAPTRRRTGRAPARFTP